MVLKRQFKTIASFVLSLEMLFSTAPTPFISSSVVTAANTKVATEEVHIWDGTSDISWYDDEETEFHISTPEQLAGLSSIVNTGKTMEGKTFILDNDIYLNDVSTYDEWETTKPKNKWTPVSTFSGTFQGGKHSIIGLYTSDGGMFTNIINGYISELNFSDLYAIRKNNSNYYASDTSASGFANTVKNSYVINCSVQGKLYSDAVYNGGLVGYSKSSKIFGCKNMSEISSTNSNQTTRGGGICGYSENTEFVNCTNKGDIGIFDYKGGICAYIDSESSIKYCINNGEIKPNNITDCSGAGICAESDGKILNCYNTGQIHGNGICYYNNGSITNVYNTGKITKTYTYAIASGGGTNAYYLSGTASKGGTNTIAKTEANMKKESFAYSLGEAFYYVEGEYPKLAFEVGRTISNFDKTSLSFKEFGETQTLTLDTTYLGESEWISSNTSVATVDADGVVTAVGNGTAMIYALCSDSKAACSVTVGYDYYLSDNELILKKGRVHNLSVFSASTGKEVADINVEWCSSDNSIVSVDSEGMITTNAVGTTAITAKVADIELNCIISVYEYQVPAIIVPDDENVPKLSETDFTISTIDSKLLSVENYNDSITWVSANTSIAKVSKNGLVKGVSEGNTAVYALLSDGRCLKANTVIIKSEYTMGDVNLDGKFNVSDVVLLQKWLLAVPDTKLKHWKNADFYEDGILNVFDLCLMKKELIAQSK